MSGQFTKVSIDNALARHKAGLLCSAGLVAFYFEIKLKYGWAQIFDPKEVCKELGISKSTLYRALSLAKVAGFLDFESTGKIKVKNVNPSQGEGCLKSDTKNSNLTQSIQISDKSRQISDSFPKSESVTPPKALQEAKPSKSPDLIQINQIKSDLHQIQNPDDDDFDFWLKKELESRRVQNQGAYLKTLDKTTGQPIIEKLREEYSQQSKNAPGRLTAHQAWGKALKLSGGYSGGGLTKYLNPSEEPRLAKAIMEVGGLATIGGTPTHQLTQLKSAFTEAYNNYSPVVA